MEQSSNNIILEQEDIKQLWKDIAERYPGSQLLKVGSNASKIKGNIIFALGAQGNDYDTYGKAYTPKRKSWGTKELELITLFNEFSSKEGASFSGPIITKEVNDSNAPFHFLMEDVKQDGKIQIDFPSTNRDTLLNLYKEYREVFDEFYTYAHHKTSSKNGKYFSLLASMQYRSNPLIAFCREIGLYQQSMKLLLAMKTNKRIQSWYNDGATNVTDVLRHMDDSIQLLTTKHIQNKLTQLEKDIQSYEFEYNFGRFWTGHVFSNGENHKILDFDNVGYQTKGTELLGIMRSNLLFTVHKYQNFEDRRDEFDSWYQALIDIIKDEAIVQIELFKKLIGTIYADYGHLMLLDHRIQAFEEDNPGIDGKKNAYKGIQWNYRLLQELYFS